MKTIRLSTLPGLWALACALILATGCGPAEPAGNAPDEAPPANQTAAPVEPDTGDEGVTEEDLSAWGGFGGHQEVTFSVDESVETRGLMKFWDADGSVGTEKPGYIACAEKAVDEYKKANPDSNATHEAVMTVQVPQDGTWYPWVLTWWYDDCGNSIYVRITDEDGGLVQKPVLVEDATTKTWHWKRAAGRGLELKQGTYHVGIINREDGARVRSVLLTTRPYANYTPANPES
jgi:hypothetical protein